MANVILFIGSSASKERAVRAVEVLVEKNLVVKSVVRPTDGSIKVTKAYRSEGQGKDRVISNSGENPWSIGLSVSLEGTFLSEAGARAHLFAVDAPLNTEASANLQLCVNWYLEQSLWGERGSLLSVPKGTQGARIPKIDLKTSVMGLVVNPEIKQSANGLYYEVEHSFISWGEVGITYWRENPLDCLASV